MSITVFKPGTPAKLGKIPVMITQVALRAGNVIQYEVSYFNQGARVCVWVEGFEVSETEATDRVFMGFR